MAARGCTRVLHMARGSAVVRQSGDAPRERLQLNEKQLFALRHAPLTDRVANRVRIAMSLLGVNQQEIIASTGLARGQLSRILNGHAGRRGNIELATVYRLTHYFGCQPHDLFPPD
jgi:DNA-binding Xre family transcriptional regulator